MAMVVDVDDDHRTLSTGYKAFNNTVNCEIGYSSWQTKEREKKIRNNSEWLSYQLVYLFRAIEIRIGEKKKYEHSF